MHSVMIVSGMNSGIAGSMAFAQVSNRKQAECK